MILSAAVLAATARVAAPVEVLVAVEADAIKIMKERLVLVAEIRLA